MLASSTQGKALIKQFQALGIGDSISLPSIFPAIPDECQAILQEKEEENYWFFELFWHGISLGALSAELRGTDLQLEQL